MEKPKQRTNLKLLRVKSKLSQEQMAEKIGCTRATYSAIECGSRNGRDTFWQDFQKAFDIPDQELWGYMKRDEQ